jgi:hypothetical protein
MKAVNGAEGRERGSRVARGGTIALARRTYRRVSLLESDLKGRGWVALGPGACPGLKIPDHIE